MSTNFLVLFKYELKNSLPGKRLNKKTDFIGNILSILITLAIAVAFMLLVYTVAESYVEIKINKVRDTLSRSAEFLNFCYTGIIIAMSIMCLEKMRKSFSKTKDREIFLRLPVKSETIFLSKMAVLMLENYVVSLLLIVPVNTVIFLLLKPGFIFWIYTAVVWLLLPMIPLLIATVFIIPYIKLVEFVSRKYWLMFVLISSLLIGSFWIYSGLLGVVQSLLETGSIKFLFNEKFLTFMQNMKRFTYPANLFSSIALGIDILLPLLIVLAIVILSSATVYFVTRQLFYATLYRNDSRKMSVGSRSYKKHTPGVSLIKKEFISVFRNPSHMFSYFAIATAMPVMVYCCYTLFESLILNALGISLDFSLALFIVLVFGVLTNTFCATNITRDGMSALFSKIFPLKPSRIILSKIIFCSLVSSLSVILSVGVLVMATSLGVLDGCAVAFIGIIFSLSQISVATRMDLNHAKLSQGPTEAERAVEKTVAKVVAIGLSLSALTGLVSVIVSMFASSVVFSGGIAFSYVIPVIISIAYLLIAMLYFVRKIERSFANLIA